MEKFKSNILLGPLLGVEENGFFTICLLVNKEILDLQVELKNAHSGDTLKFSYDSPGENLSDNNHWFYRFELDLKLYEDKTFSYAIKSSDEEISNKHGWNKWTFRVPRFNTLPAIAFISCSGMHAKYPLDIPEFKFEGWKHMLQNEGRPDYMILAGDQIYADSIMERIPAVELFIEKGICMFDEKEIDAFYLQLYIDSWSNKYMAQALAEIPNIMTWDDHDIIDGYGSYNKPYYPRVELLFRYAKRYFKYFQIRTVRNRCLLNNDGKEFTQIIQLGNALYILPDTRMFRTRYRILQPEQYDNMRNYLKNLPPLEIKLLCFVLPVPIAHRDYTYSVERIIKLYVDRYLGFGGASDDLMDHWDHPFHQIEHEQMLDFIFSWGSEFKPDYILIVSGDVHSSGAATITCYNKFNKDRYATQIISSPMVNDSSAFLDKIKNYISDDYKSIGSYFCHLMPFGNYDKTDIYTRNYIIIRTAYKNNVSAFLNMETKSGWTNIYKGKVIERKLRKYNWP